MREGEGYIRVKVKRDKKIIKIDKRDIKIVIDKMIVELMIEK